MRQRAVILWVIFVSCAIGARAFAWYDKTDKNSTFPARVVPCVQSSCLPGLTARADFGDEYAQLLVADACMREGDYRCAQMVIEDLVEAGNPQALNIAGCIMIKKNKSPEDARKGLEMIMEAAKADCVDAFNNLGYLFWHGFNDSDPNPTNALQSFNMAAQRGCEAAIINLRNLCAENGGEYLEKARIMEGLLQKIESTRDVSDLPSDQTFSYYLEKAKAGDAAAMCYTADKYFHGDGVSRNWEEAIIWLEKAMLAGSVIAPGKFEILDRYHSEGEGLRQYYTELYGKKAVDAFLIDRKLVSGTPWELIEAFSVGNVQYQGMYVEIEDKYDTSNSRIVTLYDGQDVISRRLCTTVLKGNQGQAAKSGPGGHRAQRGELHRFIGSVGPELKKRK